MRGAGVRTIAHCPTPGILSRMELEQKPPNRPNFMLVVILSGIAMLMIFALALVFVHVENGRLHFGLRKSWQTTSLVQPGTASPTAARFADPQCSEPV